MTESQNAGQQASADPCPPGQSTPVDSLAGLLGSDLHARRELFRRLGEPFPESVLQRAPNSQTHAGYDAIGVSAQLIVNRLNEVLGVGGWGYDAEYSMREGQFSSGKTAFHCTCALSMELYAWNDERMRVTMATASGTGGHTSKTEHDARKGALTSAIKKVAAMFGVGWQIYAGAYDEGAAGEFHRRPETISARQLMELHALVDSQGRSWAGFCDFVAETTKGTPVWELPHDAVDPWMERLRGWGRRTAEATETGKQSTEGAQQAREIRESLSGGRAPAGGIT